jgi:hypothetical protein
MTFQISQDKSQNSRLGRLLVNKGYITEAELERALVRQSETGSRLGEVLVAQGSLTEQDLRRTLRRQTSIRTTAAVVTMICAPLQPLTAFAASSASPLPIPSSRAELDVSGFGKLGGLQVMSDSELEEVSAQGFIAPPAVLGVQHNYDMAAAGMQHKYNDDEEDDRQGEEQIAYELADTVMTFAGLGPISGLIDANISVEGLNYGEGRQMIEVTADGGMKLYMPESIDRISMEDMRVKGSDDAATFGSVYMSDISFGSGSSYTIRARESNIF